MTNFKKGDRVIVDGVVIAATDVTALIDADGVMFGVRLKSVRHASPAEVRAASKVDVNPGDTIEFEYEGKTVRGGALSVSDDSIIFQIGVDGDGGINLGLVKREGFIIRVVEKTTTGKPSPFFQ